jgi:hypothetical protein
MVYRSGTTKVNIMHYELANGMLVSVGSSR